MFAPLLAELIDAPLATIAAVHHSVGNIDINIDININFISTSIPINTDNSNSAKTHSNTDDTSVAAVDTGRLPRCEHDHTTLWQHTEWDGDLRHVAAKAEQPQAGEGTRKVFFHVSRIQLLPATTQSWSTTQQHKPSCAMDPSSEKRDERARSSVNSSIRRFSTNDAPMHSPAGQHVVVIVHPPLLLCRRTPSNVLSTHVSSRWNHDFNSETAATLIACRAS